jgi:hypothetical protein
MCLREHKRKQGEEAEQDHPEALHHRRSRDEFIQCLNAGGRLRLEDRSAPRRDQ